MFPGTLFYLPNTSVEDSKKSVKKNKPQNLERNISCPQCGRFFRDNYHLNLHIKIHENKRAHKCTICPKAFVTQSDLKKHLLGHSTDTPYKCRICEKSFKAQSNRKLHEDTHGLNTYKCRFCNEEFSKYMERSKHELTHKEQQRVGDNGKVKFECSYCSNFFSTLEFKELHEASAHKYKKRCVKTSHSPPSKVTYNPNKLSKKCPVCHKKFKSRKEFRSHVSSEHPDKVDNLFYTTCTICQKKVSITFISYHTMAHNGVKPHACTVCDAKFPRKSELNTHMRVHNNAKSHECDICQKDFKTLRGLQVHELNHKDVSCFKCIYPHCDKTYNTQAKCTSHVRKSHQKYLEKCDICSKEIYNIYMKKHIREEHDYEEKLCDHCGITFENVAKLKKHVTAYKYNSKYNPKTVKTKSCIFCSYEGTTKQIKSHCQNKHKELLFSCCLCLHVSLTRALYEKHMKAHGLDSKEDLKLFEFLVNKSVEENSTGECDICGYVSMCHISLSSHMQVHKRLLPFEISDNDLTLDYSGDVLEKDYWYCKTGKENKLNPPLRITQKAYTTRLKVLEENRLHNLKILATKDIYLLCDSSGQINDFELSTCNNGSNKNISKKKNSISKKVKRKRDTFKNNDVIIRNDWNPANFQHEDEINHQNFDIKMEEDDPTLLPLEPLVSLTELPQKNKSSTGTITSFSKEKSDPTLEVLKETDPLITIKGKKFISLEDLQKLRDVNIGTLIDILQK